MNKHKSAAFLKAVADDQAVFRAQKSRLFVTQPFYPLLPPPVMVLIPERSSLSSSSAEELASLALLCHEAKDSRIPLQPPNPK